MPKFECDECGFRREFSIDELGAQVQVKCPNNHGKMTYYGRKRPPWHRGHALSNLVLILLLFGVMARHATNIRDGTEITILLTVALTLAVFEIGRCSSGKEESNAWFGVAQLRLIVFFFSTITMMAFTQESIDTGEKSMLLFLTSCTLGDHAASAMRL